MLNMGKQTKTIDFIPVGKRVLVEKPILEDKVLDSGIILPEVAKETQQQNLNVSKIIAIGTGVEDKELKVGQTIRFINPQELNHNGKDYYLVHENSIQLIIV